MGVISLLGTGRRREEERVGGEGERGRERVRERDREIYSQIPTEPIIILSQTLHTLLFSKTACF